MKNTKYTSTEELIKREAKLVSLIKQFRKFKQFGRSALGQYKSSLAVVRGELMRRGITISD